MQQASSGAVTARQPSEGDTAEQDEAAWWHRDSKASRRHVGSTPDRQCDLGGTTDAAESWEAVKKGLHAVAET